MKYLPYLFCLWIPACFAGSVVKPDEDVILFPVTACLHGETWEIPLHGWIFEPELGGDWRLLAQTLFGVPDKVLEAEQESLFRQRTRLFFADNEGGKKFAARLADKVYDLLESGSNGHFEAYAQIPLQGLAVAEKPALQAVGYELAQTSRDGRRFSGQVYVPAAEGISVVSDIDDTIKISEVRDRQALLENTFINPFRAVPGMAQRYRGWAEQGAAFHYVSASPWQLYPALAEFAADFPGGSWHLRQFRWLDSSFLNFFGSSREHKLSRIRELLACQSRRQFVLIGDSGEQDPEIYGELARQFGDRIVRIYIRDVTGESRDAERYRLAFRDVAAERWEIFSDPAQLPVELNGLKLAQTMP